MKKVRITVKKIARYDDLIEEYEKHTGDKIGGVISEEIYDDEAFEELKSKASSKGIPYKEI